MFLFICIHLAKAAGRTHVCLHKHCLGRQTVLQCEGQGKLWPCWAICCATGEWLVNWLWFYLTTHLKEFTNYFFPVGIFSPPNVDFHFSSIWFSFFQHPSWFFLNQPKLTAVLNRFETNLLLLVSTGVYVLKSICIHIFIYIYTYFILQHEIIRQELFT